MKRGPLKVFYSYAHQDEKARDTLDQHLELLSRRNLILRWHDRHIVPGSEWNSAIQEALESADIIISLAVVAGFPLAFSVFRSLWELANRRRSEIPGSFACGRPPWSSGWNNVQPLLDAARSHRELPGISRRPCRVR